MSHKEPGDASLHPDRSREQEESERAEEDFAAESNVAMEDEERTVSEVSDLDEEAPANGADAVPETPGDNNEERPVDYGGA